MGALAGRVVLTCRGLQSIPTSSGKVEEQAHGWLVTGSIAGCPSAQHVGSALATAAVLVVALFAAGVWVEEGSS